MTARFVVEAQTMHAIWIAEQVSLKVNTLDLAGWRCCFHGGGLLRVDATLAEISDLSKKNGNCHE